jgi:catechol 2,3-dioxygenase-like lactoylglutathione lyase family enzyme
MTHLNGILETAIYASDLERARRFYEDVLELRSVFSDNRLTAYEVGGKSILLVFRRGGSVETAVLPGGAIPGHDGSGPSHYAFAIDADQLPAWEERLSAKGVPVEGRTDWPRGGKSIYFRDPDGHLLELATPGLWPIY